MTEQSMNTFWQKLENSPFVMLGLLGEAQHSEPMTALFDRELPNRLYFFTHRENRVAEALAGAGREAMVQFASKGHDFFACLRGTISIRADEKLADRFWSKSVAAFFEGGRSDPALRLLELHLTDAELWDADLSIAGKVRVALGDEAPRRELKEMHSHVSL